jgi:hypothetical protein
MRRCVILLAILTVTACAGNDNGPSPLNVAGKWNGTIEDNLAGQGIAQVTLSQNGSSLGGIWATNAGGNINGGTVSGKMDGTTVAVTLTPSVAASCPISVMATVSGNTMTGTYAAVSCPVAINGSLQLTREVN